MDTISHCGDASGDFLGFRFIDNDVATAFQPNLTGESFVDLFLDVDTLKDWLIGAGEVVDTAFRAARDFSGDLTDEFGGL
jgi:hypothetical protein